MIPPSQFQYIFWMNVAAFDRWVLMTEYKQELFKLWHYTVPLCGNETLYGRAGARLSMPLNFYHDIEARINCMRERREGSEEKYQ